MNKEQFLMSLRQRLSGLPQEEVEERLNFYREMVEDRVEDGLSEEEAVAAVGSVEEIAGQVLADIPLTKIVKESVKTQRRPSVGEILLLVLGAPVWLPLLIALVAVVFALYVSLWSAVIALWASFGALLGGAFGGLAGGIGLTCGGYVAAGMSLLAAGMVCAGLGIFLFFGCKAATKGTALLAKMAALWMKNRFIQKEVA